MKTENKFIIPSKKTRNPNKINKLVSINKVNSKLNNNIRLENNEKNKEKEEEKENSHYKNKSTINSQKKILEVGTKNKKNWKFKKLNV